LKRPDITISEQSILSYSRVLGGLNGRISVYIGSTVANLQVQWL